MSAMRDTKENRALLLHQLRTHTVPPTIDLYSAIRFFGEAKVEEAIPVIERYLTHEESTYRMAALETLIDDFRLQKHWSTALDKLRNDPDAFVRLIATQGLGTLMEDTGDVPTLQALARVVNNTQEDSNVRREAWSEMRTVFHFDISEVVHMISKDFDLDRDVDWDFVATYLSPEEAIDHIS